jgi:hypothetical protein
MPDVLERARPGELRRVVLTVVVEALGSAHVTDRGVGDGYSFKARGHFDQLCHGSYVTSCTRASSTLIFVNVDFVNWFTPPLYPATSL